MKKLKNYLKDIISFPYCFGGEEDENIAGSINRSITCNGYKKCVYRTSNHSYNLEKKSKVVISIKIAIYYPSDKDAVIRLNQMVGRIHADVMGSYLQKFNITMSEWDDVLQKTKKMIESHQESNRRMQECIRLSERD